MTHFIAIPHSKHTTCHKISSGAIGSGDARNGFMSKTVSIHTTQGAPLSRPAYPPTIRIRQCSHDADTYSRGPRRWQVSQEQPFNQAIQQRRCSQQAAAHHSMQCC